MKRLSVPLFTLGSLSWAVSQWLLVWMFARFGGGADAVGTYTLILSIATPVFTLAQFGLRTVYLSLRIEFPWRTYVILRVLGIALAWAVLIPYFAVTVPDGSGLWVGILVLKAADLWFDLLQGRVQRVGHLLVLGVLNIVNSGMTVLLAMLLIWSTGSVTAAVFGSAAVSLAVAVTAWWVARRAAPVCSMEDRGWGQIIRAGLPSMLSEALASVSTYLPVVILSRIADESRIGVYAVASYLLTFASLSGAILKNVFITPLRQTYERCGADALRRRTRRFAALCAVTGAAAAVPVVLFGDIVLRAIYGSEFAMSHAELAVLGLAALPIAPSYVYSTALNVLNRFAGQAWIWAGAVVFGGTVGIVLTVAHADPLLIALSVAAGCGWSRCICALLLVELTARSADVVGRDGAALVSQTCQETMPL